MWKRIKNFFLRTKTRLKKTLRVVDKRPFASFFTVLGTLLVLIVISNVLNKPKTVEQKTVVITKKVETYNIGTAPKLKVQAQIRKSGVITISALTSGVVQRINLTEGQDFYRGQTLIAMSSNYQGGNLASLQRRLSEVQRNNVVDTLQQQKDLIAKQKELAEEQDEAAGETDLSELQEDVSKKQLDLQQKSLDLNHEVSQIQLQISQVTEASMFPSAPFAGVVDKVFVKVGQQVSPGTPLMQISEDIKADPVTAIAYVPFSIAKKISRIEPSNVTINNLTIKAYPFHVSQDAVEGLLYGVYYDIPESYRSQVTEQGFVQVEIPVGESDASALVPFIPVDAVYQTKEKSYVFIVKSGKAEPRTIELGNVYGSYVEVKKGLDDGDNIILNRNVIAGDKVTVQ